MSAVFLLLDPNSIKDGLWAQERGPEDNGITNNILSRSSVALVRFRLKHKDLIVCLFNQGQN
jgi:hypothetical protein